MNQTPLMAAAAAGNVPLAEALLERGADREATDHFGHNALHWAMREAFRDEGFAQGPFAALYEPLAPACIDVNTGGRLVRIDRRLTEYFLFQTLWVLFRSRFTERPRRYYGLFDITVILEAWRHLPAAVLPAARNKRAALSGVLARNEVSRDYAYNRALFRRVLRGWYQLNPQLAVRRKRAGIETWVPVYEALNLKFIRQFAASEYLERFIDELLEKAERGEPGQAATEYGGHPQATGAAHTARF